MKATRGTDSVIALKPSIALILGAIAALYGTPRPAHAGTLPEGGHFVAGSGTISANGASLTINQSAPRGVIDWNSFSIGSGNRVTFNNGAGATLNRVTGGDPSMILGSLSATGSLYLINPQGIVVGPNGTISTGGRFVASTLDADNTAFINGAPLTLAGDSDKSVINFGKIGSSGGDVFLVASKGVSNFGSISAPNGTAELAAGRQVLLQDSTSGRQVFVSTGSAGTLLNRGAIEAAQVSLQAADGNVYALSGNHEAIRATGTANRDGHVWLVADTGSLSLAGTIEARNAGSGGGTVDTTASNLFFCRCGPTLSAGVWNITTPSFTLGDGAAKSFSKSLNAGTSINVQTTGAAGANGDVSVASNVGWNGASTLTVAAYRSVNIGKGVTLGNTGSGNLVLRADSTAIDNGGSVVNHGTLDWSKSTGVVRAFYDSPALGGAYVPGAQSANPAWAPGPETGVRAQFTGYELVNTLGDLQAINTGLSGTYALGRDIDASETRDGSFVPLGDNATPFNGLFDGMGHRITSLTLMQTVDLGGGGAPRGQGLFGNIGAGARVRDLSVSATSVVTDGRGAYGILAGNNSGTIENVTTSGHFAGIGGTLEGGIAGENGGMLLHTSSSVNIGNSGLYVGGLVGENDADIVQSYATGAINPPGGGSAVGGLAGYNGGRITQSYATGSIYAPGDGYVGGLVGFNSQSASITQSYATGSVNADRGGTAGGLVGTNSGSVTQSFSTGAVSAIGGTAGGVGGDNYLGSFGKDVYWNAQTSGMTVAVGGAPPPDTAPPPSNGLTTTQMSSPTSFVGYDFGPNGVWAMPAGATHPILAWQIASPGS